MPNPLVDPSADEDREQHGPSPPRSLAQKGGSRILSAQMLLEDPDGEKRDAQREKGAERLSHKGTDELSPNGSSDRGGHATARTRHIEGRHRRAGHQPELLVRAVPAAIGLEQVVGQDEPNQDEARPADEEKVRTRMSRRLHCERG